MNNYLQLLGENINDVNLEKKINTINNKIHLYKTNKRLYNLWFKFYC